MPRPATTPKFTKAQAAIAIKADDAKRADRNAARRQTARRMAADLIAETKIAQERREAEHAASVDVAAEQQAFEAALRVDWEALGSVGSFEDYLRENGTPVDDDAPKARKSREQTYFGPMLALRNAAKSYVKASNGILCNGDRLATECGKYRREVVVEGLKTALIEAKIIEGNPYLHLNPGQQSMNLRNKARHALAAGMISMATIEHHLLVATAAHPGK